MKRVTLTLIAILTYPLLAADGDDAIGKELKALQGTWKAVAMEAGGKPLPKDAMPAFTFIVGADGKCKGKMAQSEYDARITVNPAKNPRTIDNLHENGASKGRKQYGVYKLEGDRWTVSMTPPGAPESGRPKDFATQGTTSVLFIFERVKDGRKP